MKSSRSVLSSFAVKWMNAYLDLVNRMDVQRTEEIITGGDVVEMSRYMRELLLEK